MLYINRTWIKKKGYVYGMYASNISACCDFSLLRRFHLRRRVMVFSRQPSYGCLGLTRAKFTIPVSEAVSSAGVAATWCICKMGQNSCCTSSGTQLAELFQGIPTHKLRRSPLSQRDRTRTKKKYSRLIIPKSYKFKQRRRRTRRAMRAQRNRVDFCARQVTRKSLKGFLSFFSSFVCKSKRLTTTNVILVCVYVSEVSSGKSSSYYDRQKMAEKRSTRKARRRHFFLSLNPL